MNAPANFKRNAAQRRQDKIVERNYRKWLSPFALCVKCLCPANDLAHIRGYAQGFIKPPPWHTVTLCRAHHTAQETDREFFVPLTVEEAQGEAANLFNAWEVAQDADLWLQRLVEFHGRLAQ